MNFLLVCKLQAVILAALTAAFGGSAILAYTVDDPTRHHEALGGFLVSALISGSCAAGLYLVSRQSQNLIFRREALAVIGVGWLSASVFGAIPYYLILPELGFAAAVFESASGLTTTGASILSDLESLPPSLLFWRSTSQWIGGLGVVVFFVAVLSFLGAGAKVLFSRESSAQAADLDTARVQRGVLHLLLLYLGLTVACVIALMLGGMDWFEALNHGFTTLSTGGFSTRSGSIADFHSPTIEWIIIVFMAIGGTSFMPLLRTIRGRGPALFKSTEVRIYYALLLAASGLIAIVLGAGHTFGGAVHETIRASLFQVVSIMTTTGFATADFDLWLPVTHVVLLLLMVVGGCSGSTAGGCKVIRFVLATRICQQQIEKTYRAHVVRPLRMNGETIAREQQDAVLVFFAMMLLICVAGLLAIALLEPAMSLAGSLSTLFACLFNIGPGLAEVGPTQNFAAFGDLTLSILALLMVLGRVELFAILVLFAPALWRQF